MAEEAKKRKDTPESPPVQAGGSSKIALIAVSIVVPIVTALGLYFFALAPMLKEKHNGETETHTTNPEDILDSETGDSIPGTAVEVRFQDDFVQAIMPDPALPATLLMFRVTLVCENPETAAVIEKNRARFAGLINNAHAFKTRAELNEPAIKESIEKQIVKDSNIQLNRLGKDPEITVKLRVIEAIHERYVAQDQL